MGHSENLQKWNCYSVICFGPHSVFIILLTSLDSLQRRNRSHDPKSMAVYIYLRFSQQKSAKNITLVLNTSNN